MTGRALGFWASASVQPDRPAVIVDDGRGVTYAELLKSANRIAHRLQAAGIRQGDTVSVLMGNDVRYLEVFMAATQIGAYVVPINTHLREDEVAYILDDAASRVHFTDRGPQSGTRMVEVVAHDDVERWCSDVPDTAPSERSAGAAMMYTSGTTGRPKGVRRPLPDGDPDGPAAGTAAFAKMFGIVPWEGTYLSAGPLYHSAPLNFATAALHLGHTVVLMRRWAPDATLELIDRHRVTYTHLVPTMFHRLLALPAVHRESFDGSSLRQALHAAAPCPVATKRAMLDWWGPVIWEYYAATEIGGTIVGPQEWLVRPGTVGRPWPKADVLILDDDGNPCPPGETGTIYMSNAVSGSFTYHRDAEKTREARRGRFVTVGDMGYVDERGWLFISDRRADMIISGGVNIYPAEIEAALCEHPLVADAAVIGVPNDEWGEEVKAIVEAMPGVTPCDRLVAELIGYLRDRIAGYKVPRSIDFREELPRYSTGKLLKRELRAEYWAHAGRNV